MQNRTATMVSGTISVLVCRETLVPRPRAFVDIRALVASRLAVRLPHRVLRAVTAPTAWTTSVTGHASRVTLERSHRVLVRSPARTVLRGHRPRYIHIRTHICSSHASSNIHAHPGWLDKLHGNECEDVYIQIDR